MRHVLVYTFSIYRLRDPADPAEFMRWTEACGETADEARESLRLPADEFAIWFGQSRPADGPFDRRP
jgi:hypothetical protein